MPVESITNLIQNLSDQLSGQTQNNSAQKSFLGQSAPLTTAAEDTFTPSTQNGSAQTAAQDVGLFQFAPGTLTAIRTNSTAQTAVGAPAIASTAQPAAANKSGANGIPEGPTTDSPAAQSAASAAAAANIQLQIQSLNASLPALGLTNTEINQIDRIASLVQNFNPAAYANLVSQFEALAQNSGAPASASATVLPSTNSAPNSANSATNAGYQVQNVSIKFTGSTQPGNSSFAGGGGNNFDANPPQSNSGGLQIGQVQFTLINGHGQTVQVQAP
ncbi:MAG TPA: hypothetical protein VK709_17440 [Candidatus Saccharimonadales bacterium]|jgi:hypothetical protein|nr:hypothetical protein [Candidatus Saccharimonadales bacterium]